MMRRERLTTLHIHEERGRNIIVGRRTEYGRRCERGRGGRKREREAVWPVQPTSERVMYSLRWGHRVEKTMGSAAGRAGNELYDSLRGLKMADNGEIQNRCSAGSVPTYRMRDVQSSATGANDGLATAGQVRLPQKKWRSVRDMAMATRLSGMSQGPRLRVRTENMWLQDALCQKSPRVRALEHWELAVCGNGYSGLMTCLFRILSRPLWPGFCASRKVNGHFHFQARPATHSPA